MLKRNSSFPAEQQGVVLIVSLIILVVMTIGGIALIRSVDSTGMIAGNLAFQQAATLSGEFGTEAAVRYLEQKSTAYLWNDHTSNNEAYVASTPAAGNPSSWDSYWTSTIDPSPVSLPYAGPNPSCSGRRCTLPTDAAGNTVTYTIQRLCATAGDPFLSPTGCSNGLQPVDKRGNCKGADCPQLVPPTQYYYRITSRIDGPRNTLTYVQAIVAR